MTKRNRKSHSSSNSKTKFIVIGVIVAAIIGGISIASLNPDVMKANDSQSTHLSLDTRNGSPMLGSSDAPVTIVEFGDYQCPFCKKWNTQTKPAVVKNLIETGKANLIYVDLAIIGVDSIKAHAGSYCADEQGLYWKYHDYLYANQGHENSGWTNQNNLKLLVSGIDGMDVSQFSKCLDSGKYEKRVNDNTKIARDSGARSTPSFIVIGSSGNAIPISGAQPYGVFQQVVEDMIA
ncbi:MAG: DsbA family protein [Candidatus Nitrosopumilus sp. bin_68KS]